MTSGDGDPVPALVGVVPLTVGLALTEALDDVVGLGSELGGDATGARAATGELGAAVDGAELAGAAALRRALGWLTAEQPAAELPAASTTASDTAPCRSESRVPRRYPTGGGYGRCSGSPGLSTG